MLTPTHGFRKWEFEKGRKTKNMLKIKNVDFKICQCTHKEKANKHEIRPFYFLMKIADFELSCDHLFSKLLICT